MQSWAYRDDCAAALLRNVYVERPGDKFCAEPDAAGIDGTLPSGEADPGIVQGTDVDAFIEAMAKHRHFERETDPPMV